MYCISCGKPNKDTSKFCTSCGNPLTPPPAGAANETPVAPAATAPTAPANAPAVTPNVTPTTTAPTDATPVPSASAAPVTPVATTAAATPTPAIVTAAAPETTIPVIPMAQTAPVPPTAAATAVNMPQVPMPSIPQPTAQATTQATAPAGQPVMPQIPLPQNAGSAAGQAAQAAPAPTAADAEFDKANTTWTLLQVMKERTIVPFLFAVLALFLFLDAISNILILLVVLVAGYVAGAFIMLLALQRNKTPHVEEPLVRYYRAKGLDPKDQMKFTWYSYYSVIVGFFLWAIIGSLLSRLLWTIASNEITNNVNLAGLSALVPMVVSYFIAKYAIKFMDKAIYAHSRTNVVRIAAIAEGYYNGEFKDADQLQKTVFLLKKNKVHSISGAKSYISIMNGLKKASIIGGIITVILGIFTFGMFSKFGKEFTRSLDPNLSSFDFANGTKTAANVAGNGFAQQAAQNAVQNIAQQYQNNIIAQNIANQINNVGNGNPIQNLQNLNIPAVNNLVDGAKDQLKHFGIKS